MQLGSGTYDLLPGITYNGGQGKTRWRAAKRHDPLGKNHGYSLEDEAKLTAWTSYQPGPWVSLSGRIEAKTVGRIDGIDPNIVAPVQTADPPNYGGETVALYGGLNPVAQHGAMHGHRFAIEAGLPVYQNLNGPQMKGDWTLTAGWQLAF